MNHHQNARLTVYGRELLVRRIIEQGLRAEETAQAAGVSVRMDAEPKNWLELDPCYLELRPTAAAPRSRYGNLLREAIPAGEWALIREVLARGERLVADVERIVDRRLERWG